MVLKLLLQVHIQKSFLSTWKVLTLSCIFGSQVLWLFLLELKIWNLWRQHSLDLKASIRMNTPRYLKGMTGFYVESSSANGRMANAETLTSIAYGICQIKYLPPNLWSQRSSVQHSKCKGQTCSCWAQISVEALSTQCWRWKASLGGKSTSLPAGASANSI